MTDSIDRRDLLKLASTAAAAALVPGSPAAAAQSPAADMGWWRDGRFGMFVSCGPSALIGRGDWVMGLEDIPIPEYERVSDGFRPEPGRAREWARLARKAGMTYMVFITKHHDGYCLFDTKLTDFNSMRVGPKRDLTREYVEAARAEGLKVGLYFSLMDWHHPDGMRSRFDADARRRFVDFTHGQIRELLTNYGPIAVLWYDVGVPLDPAGWRSEEMNAMARRLQPGIIVNNRNWVAGDFSTSEQEVNPGDSDWEACMTINDSWFFTPGDRLWKRPTEIVRHLVRCAQYGGNYLLNIGPRPDGSVPEESRTVLDEIGGWMRRNGEAIYRTERCGVRYSKIAGFTGRGSTLYTHVHFWPGRDIAIGGLAAPPRSARLLATGEPVDFDHSGTRLSFRNLPPVAPDPVSTVIVTEFAERPVQDSLASRSAARLHELYKETGIVY